MSPNLSLLKRIYSSSLLGFALTTNIGCTLRNTKEVANNYNALYKNAL